MSEINLFNLLKTFFSTLSVQETHPSSRSCSAWTRGARPCARGPAPRCWAACSPGSRRCGCPCTAAALCTPTKTTNQINKEVCGINSDNCVCNDKSDFNEFVVLISHQNYPALGGVLYVSIHWVCSDDSLRQVKKVDCLTRSTVECYVICYVKS